MPSQKACYILIINHLSRKRIAFFIFISSPLGEAGRRLLFPFPPLFWGLRELQQFSYFALSAWDDEENGKLFSRKKAFDKSCEAQKVC